MADGDSTADAVEDDEQGLGKDKALECSLNGPAGALPISRRLPHQSVGAPSPLLPVVRKPLLRPLLPPVPIPLILTARCVLAIPERITLTIYQDKSEADISPSLGT